MKEGIDMKHTYSRLCLKERWTLFTICAGVGVVAIGLAVYSFTIQNYLWLSAAIVVTAVMLGVCIFLFQMNMRRRDIKKEYSYEFDRELFSKERACPKCGASIGSNVCYCPKCGTKFH